MAVVDMKEKNKEDKGFRGIGKLFRIVFGNEDNSSDEKVLENITKSDTELENAWKLALKNIGNDEKEITTYEYKQPKIKAKSRIEKKEEGSIPNTQSNVKNVRNVETHDENEIGS